VTGGGEDGGGSSSFLALFPLFLPPLGVADLDLAPFGLLGFDGVFSTSGVGVGCLTSESKIT